MTADPSHIWTVQLRGTVRVPVRGAEAFRLFTPIGEKDWSDGWDPQFPAGVVDDGAAPGTVFTVAHGDETSTWMTCRREGDELVQYARVIPGKNAGTVTVRLSDDGVGAVATVDYHLTALSDTGAHALHRFEQHYPQFLAEWESAIARSMR